MKKTFKTVTYISLLILAAWLIGNVPYIRGKNPEKVAIEVANQFDVSPDLSSAILKPIEYKTSFPAGPSIRYLIIQNQKNIAEVEVRSFLGIGWQEGDFIRL